MDQNEFSVDGFSFDLNSDEFSLDSILNEYKDYDLDAAEDVPRPRAAFAAHPAEATLIDPEEPSPDETPPEIIKDVFDISKAAFKRALGHLMREGRIEQKDGWTTLVKPEPPEK